MKTATAILFLLLLSSVTSAQSPDPAKWMCRNLADSGGFLYQGETLFGNQACRPIPQASTPVQSPKPEAAQPQAVAPAKALAPAQASTEVSATEPTSGPVSMKVAPGSTVFMAPMEGFENYLAAAFGKKNVPLVPVANEVQATYIIRGTSEEKKAGWAKMAFTGQIHSDDAASIQMIDKRSGAIVFAYAVNKKNTLHGQQTTAEACAKHLKEQIEKK